MTKPKQQTINSRILTISDLHTPFMHRDTVAFLAAVKKKYAPTRVVLLGDEVDQHNLSMHDSDPNLMSASDEISAAKKQLNPIFKLFPIADVLESNHGSLAYRRAIKYGIPDSYIKDYRDVLGAPKGWKWYSDLTLNIPGGNQLYFHHGIASNIMKVVTQRGMCVIQGHFHSIYTIGYAGNPNSLLWGMQLSCMIDDKSRAFAYNKLTLGRPILGCGIVLDGLPKLLPMVVDKSSRWVRVVP